MRIEHLYRYPVKGLTAEALETTEVETGACIPWDRAFALAQGDAGFDPDAPTWLAKSNFMCLMRNAGIAALRSHFEPRSGTLSVRAADGRSVSEDAMTPGGRARIATFLTEFLGDDARGTPMLHHVPDHSFCDQRHKVLSLTSLTSLRDYEERVGARRHKRRFRSNIWFSGAPPWAERNWVGRELQMGGARIRVTKVTDRCPATQVNPITAKRDCNPVLELRNLYGFIDFGIHAEIVEGGRFGVGDAIELLLD
jgi:uncharacterized protein